MKGDRVGVVIDAGSGTTKTYDIVATRAGRKVAITHSRGVVEVSEITPGATTVRTARFPAKQAGQHRRALAAHPCYQTAIISL
jgi:hypothetical protein